jgi:glycosyltransferase involved in cell wall biosynthesis
VAALGDVLDPNCFGGSPSQFYAEARRIGFADLAWRVDLDRVKRDRWRWNAGRVFRGRRPGGFQFSAAGRKSALSHADRTLLGTDVISFHQHIPPFEDVASADGSLSFYIDATYSQLFAAYGIDKELAPSVVRDALDYEKEAYRSAKWIVASQTWTLRSLVEDYEVPAEKCAAILPAPNFMAEPTLQAVPSGVAGKERPFVIGFIGKDWRRKGLKTAVEAARILRSRNWQVKIRAIGFLEEDCPYRDEVECLGFIDKKTQFLPFLHSCDVGCLFSSAEAAGIAVLEFLAVGVPVAGFTVNGLNDLLPEKAGFRFPAACSPEEVAATFDAYLREPDRQAVLRANAREFAGLLSWRRCVDEFRTLWDAGRLDGPFRLRKSA